MNKAQLIDALAQRLGDKRTAGAAVDGMVDVIVRTVNKGEKVNITGFGVFEKRARAARMARNPRTGETVRVRKTNVPAFRAGTTFKDVVSGTKKLPRVVASSATSTGGNGTRSTTAAASKVGSTAARTASRTAGTAARTARAAASTATNTARSAASKAVKAATSKPAAKPAAKTSTAAAKTSAKPAAGKASGKTNAKAAAGRKSATAKKPAAKKK